MSHTSRIGTPLAELFTRYHATLGSPEEVFQVPDGESGGIAVDVLIYRPAKLPFDLFITLGVSLHEQTPGGPSPGKVEYCAKVTKALSPEQRKEFARSLWLLSQWPFRGKKIQPMTAWHTIGGLRALIAGSTLEGFLLKPVPSIDAPIQALQKDLSDGGAPIEILEAVGITIDEFLELHVSSVEPQEHLATVKKFVSERIPEPHINELLGTPSRVAGGRVTH